MLDVVADLLRFVEARGMLLRGTAEVLGGGASAVILDPWARLAVVVGTPARGLIQDGARRCGNGAAVLAQEENAEWTAEALEGWRFEWARIHELRDQTRLVDSGEVRFVERREIERAVNPGAQLRDELLRQLPFGPVAAAFASGGGPVAFSYAGAETETLWDVSIDTLEPHRRRGQGARCASWLIRHFAARGKRPVWGAVESNVASWRMAERLGFEVVDRLAVFERL